MDLLIWLVTNIFPYFSSSISYTHLVRNCVIFQAEPPLLIIEDDIPSAFGSQTDLGTKQALESQNLLSVDELLDSVSEKSF